MASLCASCGASLGISRRLTGATLCAGCEDRQHQAEAAQRSGMTEPEFRAALATFGDRLLIARFNAGPIAPQPTAALLHRPGEQVVLEVEAQLLKEVVEREIQGGSSGFSFRILGITLWAAITGTSPVSWSSARSGPKAAGCPTRSAAMAT